MKTRKMFVVALFVALAVFLLAGSVPNALADSNAVNFESYALGNINGQDGWMKTGGYDVQVVTNTYGFTSFGTKVLRMSDAVTSGSFGDQTFAKPLADAAGESAATAGSFSVGTRQRHFEAQFDIASAVPTAQQPGMHVSVSPDRGDGSRMSYLRFEDNAGGIDVFFDDVQQPGPCTPSGCANFVETKIATLNRAVPHTIKFVMDFLEGPGNDVVKIFIDGALVITGTSWEDYYRYDPEASAEQSPRIVKTLIFRESGTATPANSGKGFLFDNISLNSSLPAQGLVISPNTRTVAVGGTTTVQIALYGVTNLYGYQFQVNYDASKVSAVGAFDNSWFDTTTNASVPTGWNAACSAGVCKFAASKLRPAVALNGGGALGTITFTGNAVGVVPLTFSGDIIADKNSAPITHATTGGTITVYGVISVSGTVTLQGRATPIDAGTITLTDLDGNFPPTVGSFSAADGTFSFANVPIMPGGSNYQIDAAHSLYLSNRKTQMLTGAVSGLNTTLLGGDADNSGLIDVSDLTCIGGAFGGAAVTCGTTGSSDINKDTTTNILDLVLAGGNYGLSSPQPW